MKKGIFAVLLCLAASHLNAQSVTFNVSAADLQTANGALMPTNGLVMLVASTTNLLFELPTPAAFASGDEIVLKKWDLNAFATDGLLIDTTGSLPFSGNWNAGDPVRLYWFPTLTLAATAPGYGTPYGEYTDPVGIDGSAPWVTPSAGSTVQLNFFTHDEGGSNPQTAGLAMYSTPFGSIPEPSTFALVGAGLAAAWAFRRRA